VKMQLRFVEVVVGKEAVEAVEMRRTVITEDVVRKRVQIQLLINKPLIQHQARHRQVSLIGQIWTRIVK
jgi:hypothetical protein